jgi:hypothetical protein
METWATVTLVLGTNLITNLLTWFLTNRQLEHSDKRLERQLESQREAEQHKRKWEVRSQPLLELRTELALMTQKLEDLVNWAAQVVEGVSPNQDKIQKTLEAAAKDFNAYLASGKFYQAIHMQYDDELKAKAHKIFLDYQSAYHGVIAFWQGGDASRKIREANDILAENGAKVTAVQLKINELLEKL